MRRRMATFGAVLVLAAAFGMAFPRAARASWISVEGDLGPGEGASFMLVFPTNVGGSAELIVKKGVTNDLQWSLTDRQGNVSQGYGSVVIRSLLPSSAPYTASVRNIGGGTLSIKAGYENGDGLP